MKQTTKQLLGGSLILLITFNLFSLLNLIFNSSMSRMLSLADYGILTTLISFLTIFGVFSESIQTIISRYSTHEKNNGKLKNIIKRSLKKASSLSIILFLFYLLISLFLSKIFNIRYSLVALTGLMLFASFYLPITRGILQGKKKFLALGTNVLIEGAAKLIIAVVLVILGTKVFGAIIGMVSGAAFAFLASMFSLKDIFNSKEMPSKTPGIYAYSKPVFVVALTILLFLNLDIILARLFFEPLTMGAYALASTIAKIIYIGTSPIGKAMFPISVESKTTHSSYKTLVSSIKLVSLLVVIGLFIVFFFGSTIIFVYSGRIIVESLSILFYLAVSMSLLSFANLILLYSLSRGTIKNYLILLAIIPIQIILLSIFNNNIIQFSLALLLTSAIFLWGVLFLNNNLGEK